MPNYYYNSRALRPTNYILTSPSPRLVVVDYGDDLTWGDRAARGLSISAKHADSGLESLGV